MCVSTISRAGFEVAEAADCALAHRIVVNERPNLVIMDWQLPDMSGLDFTRMIKRDARSKDIAVILLSEKSRVRDKLAGLASGADDYVTKPFSPRELVARTSAVLRRSRSRSIKFIRQGVLCLDAAGHRVCVDDHDVHLGPSVRFQ